MAGVAAGGDRQDLHERIRRHSQAAAQAVKMAGRPNDLIERLRPDKAFANIDLASVMDPARYVGRAPRQVEQFVRQVVDPIRARYPAAANASAELTV